MGALLHADGGDEAASAARRSLVERLRQRLTERAGSWDAAEEAAAHDLTQVAETYLRT